MARVRIGISGWRYAGWRGDFYPRGLRQADELAYAAERMTSVEINSSFYSLQRPSSYAAWRAQTPDDFVFAVKGGRFITHMKKLTDVETPLANFFASGVLALGPKLGPVLWQLPPTFRRDDDRLARALEALPPGRHAFEFRHASWFAEPVYELLRAHAAALVIADRPEIKSFQSHELTADWTFVRFHAGTRGRRGNYSERELEEWAERLLSWPVREAFVYFNNDWEGFAIRNALRLRELLGATLPAWPSTATLF
jgi:uncharacterized protein YecE (DUF72 family)